MLVHDGYFCASLKKFSSSLQTDQNFFKSHFYKFLNFWSQSTSYNFVNCLFMTTTCNSQKLLYASDWIKCIKLKGSWSWIHRSLFHSNWINSLGDIHIVSSKNQLNFGTVLYYDNEGKRVDLWKAAIIRVYVHKIWMTQVIAIGIKIDEFIFWGMTNPKTVRISASQSNFKR